MPSGMTKRRINTTRYFEHSKKIHWRVHFIFLLSNDFNLSDVLKPEEERPDSLKQRSMNQASDKRLKKKIKTDINAKSESDSSEFSFYYSKPGSVLVSSMTEVDEDLLMEDILDKFFSTNPNNAILRHALHLLRKSKENIEIIIQKLPSNADKYIFTSLMRSSSLKESLMGKMIIEYPTLIIGLKEHLQKLPRLINEVSEEKEEYVRFNSSLADEFHNDVSSVNPASRAGQIGIMNEDSDEFVDDDVQTDINEEFLSALKELEGKDIETLKLLADTSSIEPMDILIN
jgi:hypothetical protein